MQFIEQPRVLNGDDGLGGEVLYQLDLLVVERPDLGTVDDEGADQLIFLEHRDREHSPGAGELGKLRSASIERIEFFQDVGDLNRLLSRHRASERGVRVRADYWVAPPHLYKWLRGIMHRNSPKGITFASIQDTEFGLADARRVGEH